MVDSVHCGDALLTIRCMAADRPRAQRAGQLGGPGGKVKNPWPNVDAINGSLQYHYGVKEFDFYTVLFGLSRILGLTTHIVWSRALGKPIERPKSLTTTMLEEMIQTAEEPEGIQ